MFYVARSRIPHQTYVWCTSRLAQWYVVASMRLFNFLTAMIADHRRISVKLRRPPGINLVVVLISQHCASQQYKARIESHLRM